MANRDAVGSKVVLTSVFMDATSTVARAARAARAPDSRLYTEDAFLAMAPTAEPEILRCSLAQSMLQLLCLGQDMQDSSSWTRPTAVSSALRTLFLLGALDSRRALTPLGRAMAAFPLEPAHARALLASKELACTSEVLDIVSVPLRHSSTRQSSARRKFVHPAGDHLTILNAVRAYAAVAGDEDGGGGGTRWDGRALREARAIRAQLCVICRREGLDASASCGEREEPVLLSLAHGLAQNAALITPDGSYKQIMGQSVVKIYPSSSMADKKVPAIIYNELVYTNQIYARGVSSIPKSFFASLGAFNRREA
ncbi:helicase associated domain-containing protein [Mycena latifolia]|nr:helicase associated domain-containing protein [Mycena latifolia]